MEERQGLLDINGVWRRGKERAVKRERERERARQREREQGGDFWQFIARRGGMLLLVQLRFQ